MKKWLLLALLSITLTLCHSCKHLKEGKIVDKHFKAGYYSTHLQHIGKSYIPITEYHQPRYIITVEGKNEKGELIKERWYVSSGQYESKKIGDYITDGSTDY